MKKTVIVHYSPYDSDDSLCLPVRYELINEGNSQIYHCQIEEANNKPDWLDLTDFSIPSFYENGIHVTRFSKIKGIKSIDTALFLTEVNRAIWAREQQDEKKG